MIIATAGHVDHGKTTLVRALTGVDTDRLEEERRRGLTIDLGFAYTDDGDERWGFVDVPGHHRFVGNMLAGVAGVDIALLVVAADDGPMPQTREHLAILDLLGVDRAVVALSKADLVDEARREAVHAEIDELLASTPLAGAPILPVAAPSGQGLDELRAALRARGTDRRARPGHGARFAVDRAFTVRGTGVVVTGCVHAGRIDVDDELVLLPRGTRVRVRGLRAEDRAAESGAAGQRLALNLAGVDTDAVGRGDWLAAPGIAEPVHRFDARLRLLEPGAVRSGLEVHVHHGASHSLGRVTILDGDDDAPRVHVSTRAPLAVLHDDRIVLRDAGATRTLGGGRVLDIAPPRRGRRRPERLVELDALEAPTPEARVAALLDLEPLDLDLGARARRDNADLDALLDAAGDAVVDRTDGCIVRHAGRWRALGETIVDALTRFHGVNAQLAGMGVDEIRAVLDPKPTPPVLAAALRDLLGEGRIARSATRYRLPDHRPRLAAGDRERWERIRPKLEAPTVKPPVIHDLAQAIDVPPRELAELLARVHHTGGLLRVADNRYMLPEGVLSLARSVCETAAAGDEGRFDVRAYRDATGIGRNLAIDVLEFFDRSGLTRRRGDERIVVGDPEALFGQA